MSRTLLRLFTRCKDEAAIVGRLLAGYGGLEYELCRCVGDAIADIDGVFKAMFGKRGEQRRILKANELGRDTYEKLHLGRQFSEVLAAMQECKEIRNQFAHCRWYDDNTARLCFVDLEKPAEDESIVDFKDLTIKYVNLALLKEQEDYFGFARVYMHYLHEEMRKRRGKLRDNRFAAPDILQRPPRYLL